MLYLDLVPSSHISVLQGKTGFQVKQQFVTKTLIPRILTEHITNESMKKILAQLTQKFGLYNVPLNWQDIGILNSLQFPIYSNHIRN